MPYVLITVAAPVYLKSLGQLKPVHVAGCVASLVLLAIPAVGSVYPVPPAPVMYFPYLYLAYLAVGIVWILAFYRRQPSASVTVREDLQLAHDRFTGAAAARVVRGGGAITVAQQASGEPSPDAVPCGPRVAVTLWEAGQRRAVEAYEGESLMVALKRAGLGLLAVCGGKGACGTCRVAFPPRMGGAAAEPDKRELAPSRPSQGRRRTSVCPAGSC